MANEEKTRVAFDCLGCKLNQAEVEDLSRQFAGAGYRVVPASAEAEVYILNTCAVTQLAESKARQLLRRAHRRNPAARIIAIGCGVEQSAESLAGIEGVNVVVGNGEKADLLPLLTARGCLPENKAKASGQSGSAGRRARSFLKVQDGCRCFCTYCVVPRLRPVESSVPAERVVAEVRERVAEGYREVVLTGTRIGVYRDGETDLAGLVRRILGETEIARLRLSSLQPPEISKDLVSLWENDRLCPHFHLALQSGSDGVLRRMGRRYHAGEFRQALDMVREHIPGVAVTTDVIVGFPGETEAEFAESYRFCREAGFARIHVFPYSARPGTAAARLPGAVSPAAKKRREEAMLSLAEECRRDFRQKFTGKVMPVLWEQARGEIWSGHTGNYLKVYTRSGEDLAGKLLPVRLGAVRDDGLWGEPA
ncbi:MAG: tRNA (N(6)-L-threonylcarbamoyladenosine(37)-C(2))-methylthiotransferase MtaB [Chloroflexota bacterium]